MSAHTELDDEHRSRLLTALATLQDDASRFQLVAAALDQLPDEIFLKDRDGHYILANRECEFSLGLPPGAMNGRQDLELYGEAFAKRFLAEDAEIFANGRPVFSQPFQWTLPQGGVRWNQTSKYPVFDKDGQVVAVCGQVRQSTEAMQWRVLLEAQIDVLEMLAADRPLGEVFQRIISLCEGLLEGFWGSILVLNEAGSAVVEAIAPSMASEYGDALIGLIIDDNVGTCGTACYRGVPVYTEDILTDHKWDDYRVLVEPYGLHSCWSMPYFNADGTVHGTFGLYSRQPRLPSEFESRCLALGARLAELAVERERVTAQLRIMAERDSLTGLPNRSAFSEILARELASAHAEGRSLGVAVLDIDDFRLVNDRHGHTVGDAFLTAVSARMVKAIRPGDVVARLGADEFVVVLREAEGRDARGALHEFLAAIRKPVDMPRLRLGTSMTAGLALFPQHGNNVQELLSHATTAMNRAKQVGYDSDEVYDPEFSRQQEERRQRIEALRESIATGGIDLDFQPLMNLHDGSIYGFEALARWQHPHEGRLGPGAFIPLAEQEGLIVELGGAVLTRACREAARWNRDFGVCRSVSVNVSAQQFSCGEIRDQVRHALAESGLDPALLELELTESMLLDDECTAIAIMSELKTLGISIAIDDFGTGFSNLGALARLPVDRLKIDRSIISDIETNDAAASIASAIIAMGQRLGLRVLAEGVETRGQMEFLRVNHCDDLQGFLLGRPMPSADVRELLSGRSPQNSGLGPQGATSRRTAAGRQR
ncbi:sensor domain-containing protein [Rhizobium sp. C4]|uniref:sensor domain-containing protein n=1 Tax=Rhizobium sp. C4 TaxID=1349800 RepID=UPI001E2E1774|nr:EAL domain-containing protein [Rhizobium sp. C4]MCD2173783.1 EAL domain-containing protein [Rhizobium sp. C4]